jgi:epoxyqueuosine reductase QueG
MSSINIEIEQQLRNEHVDIIQFVDISMLDMKQNRGLPFAILIGIAINPHFLEMVCNTPNYTHTLEDEYTQTENRVGMIADKLANNLISSGYKALSQSDNGLMAEKAFDFETKTSALPHKTIALLSGIGYIGKNNLFITKEYGAAQCLCSVLTDAPLTAAKSNILLPKCNRCMACHHICPQKVLKGVCWNTNVSRDEIVDVYNCITCLKCLACCPKTRAYMKRAIRIQ